MRKIYKIYKIKKMNRVYRIVSNSLSCNPAYTGLIVPVSEKEWKFAEDLIRYKYDDVFYLIKRVVSHSNFIFDHYLTKTNKVFYRIIVEYKKNDPLPLCGFFYDLQPEIQFEKNNIKQIKIVYFYSL